MKVLIVGLGSIAKKHITALKNLRRDVQIYALRSNCNAEPLDEVINLFSIQDIETIPFKFVIISNPTSEHIATINKLSFLRVPLFIEKPLSDNLDIGECLIRCENLLTYIACNLRFLDCLLFVRGNISNKRINEINVYCGSFLPDWRPNVDWRTVYSANKEMGGGVHVDLIHEIDYIYWFFGEPKHVKKHFRSTSSLEISAIDYANYILDYDLFTVSIVLNYYRRDYKRSLEIVFESETWLVDLEKNTIMSNSKIIYESKQKLSDTLEEQMSYFLSLVESNSVQSQNSISNAYSVLKSCLNNELN